MTAQLFHQIQWMSQMSTKSHARIYLCHANSDAISIAYAFSIDYQSIQTADPYVNVAVMLSQRFCYQIVHLKVCLSASSCLHCNLWVLRSQHPQLVHLNFLEQSMILLQDNINSRCSWFIHAQNRLQGSWHQLAADVLARQCLESCGTTITDPDTLLAPCK